MSQLHIYVPDDLAEKLKENARTQGLSLSRYVSNIVQKEFCTGWPALFFTEVVGGWKGEPLRRPDQGDFEQREEFDVPARH